MEYVMFKKKKWDVFISYSRKDSTPVAHVVRDLRSSGLSVWYDVSEMQFCSRIRKAIAEGIQNSKSFLVFLSKRSISSSWVINNELDSAMQEELSNRPNFVITVLIGNISIDEI